MGDKIKVRGHDEEGERQMTFVNGGSVKHSPVVSLTFRSSRSLDLRSLHFTSLDSEAYYETCILATPGPCHLTLSRPPFKMTQVRRS